MALKSARPNETVTPPKRVSPEVEGEVTAEDGHILKTLTLKFPSGYSFTISIENDKMTVESKLRERQAFLLDEIPASFIKDLKNMLQEF